MEDARRQGVGSLKTLVIEMPFSKALGSYEVHGGK